MEDKSNNKTPNERESLQPEAIDNLNPVDKSFYNSDDPKYPSNSITGSGYSQAERDEHDATNSDFPADPNDTIKLDN